MEMYTAPGKDYSAVARHPQVLANGYNHEVEHPRHEPVRMAGIGVVIDGETVTIPRLSPQLGERTEGALLDAGDSWAEISQLRDEGVIGSPPSREERRRDDGADEAAGLRTGSRSGGRA